MPERVDAHFAPAGSLGGELLGAARQVDLAPCGAARRRSATARPGSPATSTPPTPAAPSTAVAALGARVDAAADGAGALAVEIAGFGLRGASAPGGPIDVGNAGTLIRLLSGLLAGQEGRSFVLDGDESIRSPPDGAGRRRRCARWGRRSRPPRAGARR